MVRVLRWGRYRIYVYKEIGNKHHEPHCHVDWSDGRTTVALDGLTVLAGSPLPTEVRVLLRRHLNELQATWDRLNAEE